MSDIFDETEENLRADKWAGIVKNALPAVGLALGGALVLSLAVWGYQSYQDGVGAKASETYQAAMDANSKNDLASAKAKFEEVAKSGNSSYKAMAWMQLGGMAVTNNNTAEAGKDFDEAAKASSTPLIHDMAVLKSAYLAMDTAKIDDMKSRLTPLAKDGRPYALLAREALAMAKLQSGDTTGARADLLGLSLTLGAPDGLKQRTSDAMAAIDSGAFPTAKALMAMPEAQVPVMPQGMMQQQGAPDGAPVAQ